ncbi:MAG: tetratricopeptide repeat protein, partial [Flavipsychrobacter sp.]|nr:tetratricopeptide repeat protein [Flavipsychrobacter sp.]
MPVFLFSSCGKEDNADTKVTPFSEVYDEAILIHDAGDIHGSMRYLDSAFQKIQPESKIDRYSFYTLFYNIYRRDLNDYGKALLYADSMIATMKDDKKPENAEAVCHAYSSKGDALVHFGKFEEAYNCYHKARIFADNAKNTCALGDLDYRLGMVLYKQERYSKATQNFKEAFEHSKACNLTFNKFYRQQEVLDNIGLCYQRLNMADSALAYYQQALDYIAKHGVPFQKERALQLEQARAVIYGNMAESYHQQGRKEEAKKLLTESINVNSRKGYDFRDGQTARLKLAGYYLDEANTDQARLILDEAQAINDTVKNEDIALSLYKLNAQYYRHKNDVAQAYDNLMAFTELEKKLDVKKQKLLETDFTERFASFQKEQEIATLEESNRRKQEYLVLLVIGALMSLVIGLLIIHNWRKSRMNVVALSKLNRQIKDQNQQLAEAYNAHAQGNKEKDRILRAVSHDIRNPILAVSSLADLMHLDTDTYNEEQKEYITLIQEACAHA